MLIKQNTKSKMKNYQEFLKTKKHSSFKNGFLPEYLPEYLKPFQSYIVKESLQKGRMGIFADTGLGKTAIELVLARNINIKTNKAVLILTPLAVAFQFLQEAEKIGIDDIEYSKDGKFKSKIVITNYERLHHFDSLDFEGLILDESSILKNYKGAIKNRINTFIKKIKYRFALTATPSPNDYIELGTSSEALGNLGYTDMLTKFFTNNEDTISPQNLGVKWILKGHAQKNFWEWVSSWSMSIRKPSDIGFSDDGYILPELIINKHSVKNNKPLTVNGQYSLLTVEAKGFKEIQAEGKNTITQRCEKAVDLANNHETSVYWTNLNPEADLIEEIDKTAVQVKGPMSIDKKEEILLAFSNGEIKKLITKAKITSFGLNWQHCNHTTFFPTYSYEQYYQALRRFWRFGQKREVTADLVISEGQGRIMRSLQAKMDKADKMFSLLNENINRGHTIKKTEFNKEIQLPNFLNK